VTKYVRDISQQFWSNPLVPHLTIRTTEHSVQGYKSHSHPEFSIGIIKSGSTCLSIDQERTILKPDDMIIIEPNKVHACNPIESQPRSYYMLYIDNHWCCEHLSTLYGYPVTRFICEQQTVKNENGWNHLINELLHGDPQTLVIEINQKLTELLSRHCSPINHSEQSDKLAYQVKNCLLENIENPPTLDVIAARLGRSKEAMIRCFKLRFGITPKSFLNNNRIEKAKILLRSGTNIVDAATEVGFSDQSQFHRAFVKYTASTPRQYQQANINFRQ
jgi:AraC-like DNA-binding protein